MADILTVSHLQKSFGHLKAVDDLSFEVREGEILGMMGPNGAGKTTVFNLLTGVILPDRGTILFKGKPIPEMRKGEWDQYRSQVSYLFQDNALFDSMTVFDNVALPLRRTTRMSPKEIEKKVMA